VDGSPGPAACQSGCLLDDAEALRPLCRLRVVSVGIVALLFRGPQSTLVAVAAATFIMAWIAYGGLWLARAAPREDPMPRWLGERSGYID
jgi:hypothetical protein